MENNKVNVRIYGQEYTIAGEKDEETIRKIASHVNDKMRQLGRGFSTGGQGTLAVLTAINITDEYFDAMAQMQELKEANEAEERDGTLSENVGGSQAELYPVQGKCRQSLSREKAAEEKCTELEAKCSEYENSYFDLQMENMRLKRELEEYKELDER